jgi:hypothetical protein
MEKSTPLCALSGTQVEVCASADDVASATIPRNKAMRLIIQKILCSMGI